MTTSLLAITVAGCGAVVLARLRRLGMVHFLLGRRALRRVIARRIVWMALPTVMWGAARSIAPQRARRVERRIVEVVAAVLGRPAVRGAVASLARRTRRRSVRVRRWT